MTPVRNEAWVIRAFLEITSRWADYIIVADQMSTDGSREIIREYAEYNSKSKGLAQIILIDNNNPEFNEAERQSMLVSKAREVAAGRDTLLWGLDADEIIAANAFETADWNKIINSEKGSVFFFKWAEILPDQKRYWLSKKTYYPWLFHDDGLEPHGNYVSNMHSMRIPYPIEEKLICYVDDFRVLHLAYLNIHRVQSKRRFYQFVDWEMNKRSPISLSIGYTQMKQDTDTIEILTPDMLYSTTDIFSLVDTEISKCYMDDYIVERMPRHPMKELRKLDIWDKVFVETYNLTDPRKWFDKIIHHWLHFAVKHKRNIFIKIIDKIIVRVYQ